MKLTTLSRNPRFYQRTDVVRDSEPICAIVAVSYIHFRRSEKLHICKSNSLEVTLERRRIVISRPELVVLEHPFYNRSVNRFSEPLQQRRGGRRVEDDSSTARKSSTAEQFQQGRGGRKVEDDFAPYPHR